MALRYQEDAEYRSDFDANEEMKDISAKMEERRRQVKNMAENLFQEWMRCDGSSIFSEDSVKKVAMRSVLSAEAFLEALDERYPARAHISR